MNQNIQKIIGQRIRVAREACRMTQDELGKKLGFTSGAYVSRWENGIRAPQPDNMKKLSEVLDKPISWLYGDQNIDASRNIPDKLTLIARQFKEELGKFEITASEINFVEVPMYVLTPEVVSVEGLLVQEPLGYVKIPKSQIDTVPPESYKDLFALKITTGIGEQWGIKTEDIALILHGAEPVDGKKYLATYNEIMVVRRFYWEGKKRRMIDADGVSVYLDKEQVKFSGRIILHGHWTID